MKKYTLLFALLFIFSRGFTQFSDNFSDGDFISNPTWQGNIEGFKVTDSLNLHLNAAAEAAESFLFTESNAIYNASWEVLITMDFNPSSSNKAQFILNANTNNPNNFQGYFIEVGSTKDNVSLHKKKGTSSTKLIEGVEDFLDMSKVNVRVKATLDSLGNWQLFADSIGGENYKFLGQTNDLDYPESNYTMLLCDYTSTRANKFWFDDVVVTGMSEFPDVFPPEILSSKLIGDSIFTVEFNENIEPILYENLSIFPETNFTISQNEAWLSISFPDKLINGTTYQLSFSGIADLSENKMVDTSLSFQYLVVEEAKYRDVVINEIFCDPNPKRLLPEEEFIELYNTSNKFITLKNWFIVNSGTAKTIPEFVLRPKSFVLLCSTGAVDDLKAYGDVLGVSGWLGLTNAGDDLAIQNAQGQTIDEVSYTDNWYGDEEKEDGGWTLEQIDPTVSCSSAENWKASKGLLGGTPCSSNSILVIRADKLSPSISHIVDVTSDSISILFSERINPFQLATVFSQDFTNATISFNNNQVSIKNLNLNSKIPYAFTISLFDCANNDTTINLEGIYLPEEPTTNDIVINEILFNPHTGGTDFVELLNVSDKYISLQSLQIGSTKEIDTVYSGIISEYYNLLKPYSYIYLSEDKNLIEAFYTSGNNNLEIDNLPSMNDDDGHIAVLTQDSTFVDQVFYSDKDHLNVINNVKGISLEKINPEIVGKSTEYNWHSAASSVGYATPGLENSQFSKFESSTSVFEIVKKRMSPDNDGTDDVLEIIINTDPGIASINIFNTSGVKVAEVGGIEILGKSNYYTWDGITLENRLIQTGNYILLIEVITEEGEVVKFKDAFAVVSHF